VIARLHIPLRRKDIVMSRHLSRLLAQLALFARITGLTRIVDRARGEVRAQFYAIRRFSLLAWVKDLPNLVVRHALHLIALAGLVYSMGGSWMIAADANASPGRSAAAAAAGTSTTASTSPSSASSSSSSAVVAAPIDDFGRPRTAKKDPLGKLNLNTATEEQLMLLPTVGPSKAERIVTWRKKNGSFRRTADLRRVKGFGYKTFKRLEPYLDIKGESSLVAKQR
jgi:competence ComEA-like helix-hairpin-helix protein